MTSLLLFLGFVTIGGGEPYAMDQLLSLLSLVAFGGDANDNKPSIVSKSVPLVVVVVVSRP